VSLASTPKTLSRFTNPFAFGSSFDEKVFDFDTLGTLLWKGFGLKFKDPAAEKELEGMNGSMVDLDANFIASGPFRFIHTGRPQEHLTLNRSGQIRIYASKTLQSTAYMFQNHRIAR
jgi:hypothetical protein